MFPGITLTNVRGLHWLAIHRKKEGRAVMQEKAVLLHTWPEVSISSQNTAVPA
jgi:hypothetical protein